MGDDSAPPAEPPKRIRVVLSEAATRAVPEPTTGTPPGDPGDSDADAVEEALVEGLVRAQLALAVRLSLVVVAGLGALPLLFAVAPAVARVTILGAGLPWLLLGFVAFPFLMLVGWAYVRWAERNEQDFAAVVSRHDQ